MKGDENQFRRLRKLIWCLSFDLIIISLPCVTQIRRDFLWDHRWMVGEEKVETVSDSGVHSRRCDDDRIIKIFA